MTKTIFITGTNSGIGKATVEKFLQERWNVVATMRNLIKSPFQENAKLLVLPLDVTNAKQIKDCYKKAIDRFEKIDVLVNNAGYGLLGPIEELSLDEIKHQFEVNVFGLIEVTKQFLPHFRKNKYGIIVNISSMYGKISMPYFGMYEATKYAVEGISETLAQEVNDFCIQVKIIEPGAIKTNFFKNATIAKSIDTSAYNPRFKNFIKSISAKGNAGDDPNLVAEAIYKAVASDSNKMRYITDKTAHLLLNLHRFLPFEFYKRAIKKAIG